MVDFFISRKSFNPSNPTFLFKPLLAIDMQQQARSSHSSVLVVCFFVGVGLWLTLGQLKLTLGTQKPHAKRQAPVDI
jgi:bacteriorhodopsin